MAERMVRDELAALAARCQAAIGAARRNPSSACDVVVANMLPAAREWLLAQLNSSGFANDMPELRDFVAACTTHVVVRHGGVAVHVCTPSDETTPPVLLVRRVVLRLACALQLHGVQKELDVWWLPFDGLRVPPRSGEVLSGRHINGGFTTVPGRNVVVFRREEFAKVALHELFHHLPMCQLAWPAGAVAGLKARMGVGDDTQLVPNEAVVEFLANLHHIVFVATEQGLSWRMLLRCEQRWALCQAQRVLRAQAATGGVWRERTNAFAYLVLRAILLCHAHDALHALERGVDGLMAHFDGVWAGPAFRAACRAAGRGGRQTLRMTLSGDM